MSGHAQRNETCVFDISAGHTLGTDPNAFARLKPVEKIPAWWLQSGTGLGTYAGSYAMWKGKLWAAPKTFYETAPKNETLLVAIDGEKLVVQGLRGQAFGGFVKPATGDPYIGAGGNDSGQGGSYGPTLGTLAGQSLVDYPWQPTTWENRALRPANYRLDPLAKEKGDVWYCFNPRPDADGVLQGRWAADQVYGAGVVHSTGIYRWVCLGVGDINYAYQTRCLSKRYQNAVYRYHPTTYQLLDITNWGTDGEHGPDARLIAGGELSPDGKLLYVMQGYAWKAGLYTVEPILWVYEVK